MQTIKIVQAIHELNNFEVLNINDMSEYVIYTDGGYSYDSGNGGFAYIILKDGEVLKKQAIGVRNETNNRCELMAILNAVKEIPANSYCTLHTDSKYSIGVLSNRHWKPKLNTDLIGVFKNLVAKNKINVEFEWVKGHSGSKWNEECDRMCNEIAGKSTIDRPVKKKTSKKPVTSAIVSEAQLKRMNFDDLKKLYRKVSNELGNRIRLQKEKNMNFREAFYE